jgi:hypothetical protein
MKRALLLSIGLLALPGMAEAQMTLDIGGGVNFSTFYGDDADFAGADKGSRTGFFGGATLWIPVGERVAVGPGAFFVQKGARYSDGGDDLTIQTSYFEIPLLVAFMLSSNESSFGINLFAGPSISFEVACDVEASGGGFTASIDCDAAGLSTQSTDFGAVAGAGLWFPVGERLSIGVSGGVEFGLRTLDTSEPADDVKSRSIFAGVSVGIPIGG